MNRSSVRKPWLAAAFVLWGVSLVQAASSERQEVSQKYTPMLEKILTTNIVPFWHDKSLDRTNGGYTISFDIEGKLKEPVTKMIVTQARQVWLFSRLARAGYEPKKNLEAAELGYRFLIDKMWDPKNGGFYWEVDATGNQKLKPNKHLYGQSFALYALSEYYLASGRKDVLTSPPSSSTCWKPRPTTRPMAGTSSPSHPIGPPCPRVSHRTWEHRPT